MSNLILCHLQIKFNNNIKVHQNINLKHSTKKLKVFFLLKTLLCVLPSLAISQSKKFELNGYVSFIKYGEVRILVSLKNDKQFQINQEKVIVKNGRFKFKGKLFCPTEASFIFNDTLPANSFFIDADVQKVIIKKDLFNRITVFSNAKTEYEYVNIYKENMKIAENDLNLWYDHYWALLDSFHQRMSIHTEDSMQDLKKRIVQKRDSSLFFYIKRHPKSYVSLWNLYDFADLHSYRLMYDKCYYLLAKNLQTSVIGMSIKNLLDNGKKTIVGSIFPDIPLHDSGGNSQLVSRAIFKKYTLIDFWFSHCEPCLKEFAKLRELYIKYNTKGFEILGISIDKKEDENNWKAAIDKYQLLWPQYWDVNQQQSIKLSINAFPTNFLLDSNGLIIAKNLEPLQLEKFLKEKF